MTPVKQPGRRKARNERMHKAMKKAIIILFLIIFTLNALFACKSPEAPGNDTTASSQSDSTEDTAPNGNLQLPETGFNGEDFVVLTGLSSVYTMWNNIDIVPVEGSEMQISAAVEKRNSLVEKALDVVIKSEADYWSVYDRVNQSYMSGDVTYDAHLSSMIHTAPLTSTGMLRNIKDLPYINTENPWWDSSAAADSEVLGALYYVWGDLNINDDNATWGIFVNRNLRSDLMMENRYNNVADGTWTIDLLTADCKKAALDLDNNGVMNENDRFGMTCQYQSISALFNAFGGYSVKTDNEGIPEFTADDEDMITLLMRAQKFMLSTDTVSAAERYKKAGDNMYHWTTNSAIFSDSRALYSMGPLCSLFVADSLRTVDFNYGVLPLPKYDEAQENYYNTFQADNVTAYSVPIQNPYTDKIGAVLEAMAYYSTDTLKYAYTNYCLEQKGAQGDEENIEMLNLIFSTRVNDLGFCYNWGELKAVFNGMSGSDTSPVTIFAMKLSIFEEAVAEFVEAVRND